MSVTAVISQGIGVIFLWTIFSKIPLINGWRFWDVVLIYSLVVIAEGLSQLFTQGIWNLSWVVNTGDLDPILIRPYSPVLQILSSQVGMNGLGNMALGIGLLAAAVSHIGVSWPAWRVALAIVLLDQRGTGKDRPQPGHQLLRFLATDNVFDVSLLDAQAG